MGRKSSARQADGSALERLSAAVGLLTVIAVLAFLGWQGIKSNEGPPSVTLGQGQITRTAGGYVVEIVARNSSSATVADLHVEGTLKQGDEEVERSVATLSYVPARSQARGGLIFTQDPARYRLELRPTGYEEP